MLLFLSFEHANRLRGGLRFAFLLARARPDIFNSPTKRRRKIIKLAAHKTAPGRGAIAPRHEIKQSDVAAEELIIAMPLSFFLPGEVIIPFPK